MAELPAEDDLDIFDIQEVKKGERIFCKDLARFLGCGVKVVQCYARDRQCLHFIQGHRCKFLSYVTPYMAARVIVYVRAKQEEKREKAKRAKEAWVRRKRASAL
jgi:hypothetical protein